MEPNLANTMGGEVGWIQHFRWQLVLEMKWNSTPRWNFPRLFFTAVWTSDQVSVVGSCDDAAMLKIVSTIPSASQNSRYTSASQCNNAKFSGRWRRGMFSGHILHSIFRTHLQLKIVKRSCRDFYWTGEADLLMLWLKLPSLCRITSTAPIVQTPLSSANSPLRSNVHCQ